MSAMHEYVVILFYKFAELVDPAGFAEAHRTKCRELGLTGRMLVAHEGVNATFEGTTSGIEAYKKFLSEDAYFDGLVIKESAGNGRAFPGLKVKVRDEVVTLGAGRFDVEKETAARLKPKELDQWYKNNEDFVVLDLRNSYEIASGAFDRTIDPGLENFRDLSSKIGELGHLKNKKVVTVCTGGIRCEKATCLLKREGFTDVYQLEDGIHTYMKEYPGKNFKGTLFVFDNRMTTDVVPAQTKVVIGKCVFCSATTEQYCTDDTVRPSKKMLCCSVCVKDKSHLRISGF
jgi:UPF0176 protein